MTTPTPRIAIITGAAQGLSSALTGAFLGIC